VSKLKTKVGWSVSKGAYWVVDDVSIGVDKQIGKSRHEIVGGNLDIGRGKRKKKIKQTKQPDENE
jgi:hypothetical protein